MKILIILHGWGASSKSWLKVKKILENQGYIVFTPDLPGFGLTPVPTSPWTVDDYTRWVNDFSEKQNISQFFLLGHSFGGRIAIKYAVKYPQKIQGLILLGAAGIKQKEPFISKITPLLKVFSFLPGYQFLRKIFYKYILGKTDYLELRGVMRETFKKILEENLTPYLPQIKAPSLILWGKKDKITPITDAYLMKEKIKNSKLEISENIGHSPHLKDPEILSEKILDFLKK